MSKVYKKFKEKEITKMDAYSYYSEWAVVSADDEEFVIAYIPRFLKHPGAVARALSSAMNNSKYSLTDLI